MAWFGCVPVASRSIVDTRAASLPGECGRVDGQVAGPRIAALRGAVAGRRSGRVLGATLCDAVYRVLAVLAALSGSAGANAERGRGPRTRATMVDFGGGNVAAVTDARWVT